MLAWYCSFVEPSNNLLFREKIKAEDLPETVKTTLNGDEYTGWLIQSAYKIKSKDQYEVELKKGAETKTVKLDKDGKIIA